LSAHGHKEVGKGPSQNRPEEAEDAEQNPPPQRLIAASPVRAGRSLLRISATGIALVAIEPLTSSFAPPVLDIPCA
jgi:hypothetical protein